MAVLALAAALALPHQGVLVVGKTLAGVRIGMTPAAVERAWGPRHSRCRSCRDPTWYFTYRRFRPEGAAVEFRHGRVSAVWTLWSPLGWMTSDGKVVVGGDAVDVGRRFGALLSLTCGSYRALLLTRSGVTTVFYVYGSKLWGFGLERPNASPCH